MSFVEKLGPSSPLRESPKKKATPEIASTCLRRSSVCKTLMIDPFEKKAEGDYHDDAACLIGCRSSLFVLLVSSMSVSLLAS